MQQTNDSRDFKVDFLRGAAILIVCLAHCEWISDHQGFLINIIVYVLGENAIPGLFVFLSGFTLAFNYQPSWQTRGAVALLAKSFSRAWRLYIYQLVILVIILDVFFNFYTRSGESPFLYPGEGWTKGALAYNLRQALTLNMFPDFMDILPLFVVLTIAMPFGLVAYNHAPRLSLAASLGLYVYSQLSGLLFQDWPVVFGGFFFNPLAWQLIFFLGLFLGIRKTRGEAFSHNRGWLVLSAATALTFMVLRLLWGIDFTEKLLGNKGILNPLDLINFLALTHLGWRFLPASLGFWSSSAARPLVLCGRYSLQLFCLGVIFTYMAGYIMRRCPNGITLVYTVNTVAIAGSIFFAYFMHYMQRIKKSELFSRKIPGQE